MKKGDQIMSKKLNIITKSDYQNQLKQKKQKIDLTCQQIEQIFDDFTANDQKEIEHIINAEIKGQIDDNHHQFDLDQLETMISSSFIDYLVNYTQYLTNSEYLQDEVKWLQKLYSTESGRSGLNYNTYHLYIVNKLVTPYLNNQFIQNGYKAKVKLNPLDKLDVITVYVQ